MSKKYRLITNGYDFKIQRRKWYFFWEDLKSYEGPFGMNHPAIFETKDSAEIALEEIIEKERRGQAKYKEIPTKKLTHLWDALNDRED